MSEYIIKHVSDILNIPEEHRDEFYNDLKTAIDGVDALIALARLLGENKPLNEVFPEIRFTPDGKNEKRIIIQTDEDPPITNYPPTDNEGSEL